LDDTARGQAILTLMLVTLLLLVKRVLDSVM